MKNILIVLLFFFTINFISVRAQNFNAGIKGGFSASQINGDQVAGYNKLGIGIGGYISYPININHEFRMEMYYIGKGSSKREYPEFYDFTSFKIHLDYIEVPLLVRGLFKDLFYWEAGISVATLIGDGKEIYNDLNLSNNYLLSGGVFKKFDFGFDFGVIYPLNEKINIGVRSINTFPLTPIRTFGDFKIFDVFNPAKNKQYNVVMLFNVEYKF